MSEPSVPATQRRTFLADVAHELRTPLGDHARAARAMIDGIHPRDDDHRVRSSATPRLERLVGDVATVAWRRPERSRWPRGSRPRSARNALLTTSRGRAAGRRNPVRVTPARPHGRRRVRRHREPPRKRTSLRATAVELPSPTAGDCPQVRRRSGITATSLTCSSASSAAPPWQRARPPDRRRHRRGPTRRLRHERPGEDDRDAVPRRLGRPLPLATGSASAEQRSMTSTIRPSPADAECPWATSTMCAEPPVRDGASGRDRSTIPWSPMPRARRPASEARRAPPSHRAPA